MRVSVTLGTLVVLVLTGCTESQVDDSRHQASPTAQATQEPEPTRTAADLQPDVGRNAVLSPSRYATPQAQLNDVPADFRPIVAPIFHSPDVTENWPRWREQQLESTDVKVVQHGDHWLVIVTMKGPHGAHATHRQTLPIPPS